MADRSHQIQMCGKELLTERFKLNLADIHKHYVTDWKPHILDLQQKCGKLFVDAADRQKQATLADICYLCISLLRSSTLTGTYEVQLALYDKDYYLCKTEMLAYWDTSFLYRYLDADIAYFGPAAKKKIIRLGDYEIKEYRSGYLTNYNLLLCGLCANNLETIRSASGYDSMGKDGDFKILFGDYLMRMIQLFPEEHSGEVTA